MIFFLKFLLCLLISSLCVLLGGFRIVSLIFTFYSLKPCSKALSCYLSMSLFLSIFIASHFLSSKTWRNLSSSSIVDVLPFSLAAFRALSCSYFSCCLLKYADLFRVTIFRIVCPCVLENQAIGPSSIYETVFHHYPPSVHT